MVPHNENMSAPAPAPAERARRLGIEARRFVGPDARAELSAAVVGRILDLREVASAGSVALYLALDDEVDPAGLTGPLGDRHIPLRLPRIGDGLLEFVAWTPGEEMGENRFGIAEPSGEAVDIASIDVILLPCVAVDPTGTRVGFGAGYYDRTLAAVPRASAGGPLLVGAAFEVQCMAAIERREWDVPLDVVVTDSRTIRVA